MAKKRGRPPAGETPRGLTGLSTVEIQSELRRRSRHVHGLVRRRDQLVKRLQDVNREIQELGGPAMINVGALNGVRKRPRNEANLEQSLAKVLKGKTMSVTDAAEAVLRAGYKTTSSTFRTIVNQTLIKSKLFKKISRGKYTAA